MADLLRTRSAALLTARRVIDDEPFWQELAQGLWSDPELVRVATRAVAMGLRAAEGSGFSLDQDALRPQVVTRVHQEVHKWFGRVVLTTRETLRALLVAYVEALESTLPQKADEPLPVGANWLGWS
ncbi:MAG: hypothetical protein ACUVX1_15740, partial [Chloroflexota bacterium]